MTDPLPRRVPLDRAAVLRAAVAFADERGADAISMRALATRLGVVPMALYKHVANKDELLDGMADLVLGEIAPAPETGAWHTRLRTRILSARDSLDRHPWAAQVLDSRTRPTADMLAYLDDVVGILGGGGLSPALTHHALHVLGSRVLGYSSELFDDSGRTEVARAGTPPTSWQPGRYPHLDALLATIAHDAGTVVRPGCDDRAEFTFALDLILDALERRRAAETPAS